MAKRMLISVTQEDINNGSGGDCSRCPVALALLRHFPEAKFAYVTKGILEAYTGTLAPFIEYYLKAKTPRSVLRFIRRYDTHLSVRPFKFYVINEEG